MSQPLSLYIHIPFCAAKCRYCDFYSERVAPGQIEDVVRALARELGLAARQEGLDGREVGTIFCGGGTPSLLSPAAWGELAKTIRSTLTMASDCEWSLECNPDSFAAEKAAAWLDSGVNRLTFGVQSLDERELAVLGRVHSARQALQALSHPILQRFASVGVDVMYGLPGQTEASLATTLQTLLAFPHVKHLSAYELTIAENTPFGRHRRLLPLPDEDRLEALSELVFDMAAACGFERYEISNFARPGHRCRHNQAYWSHAAYRGIGPAAHSFLPPRRFANVGSIARYLELLGQGVLPIDFRETLDAATMGREMIFLRLRTAEGLDEREFAAVTGRPFRDPRREPLLERLLTEGKIAYVAPFWRLSRAGFRIADAISRELMD